MTSNTTDDIRIVRINGKDFVSGLMWHPLQKPRAYMREAREIGKREGMDIVSIRPGNIMIQAGFVKKGDGVTRGMYSLASALAGQIKHESWIGAFLLPTGQYALIAVNDGLILPGCDVIGSKQEIHNLLREKDSQQKIIKFDQVYHPADFDYRGEFLDIEDVLVPAAMRKAYTLKALTFGLTKREVVQLSCAFAALLCLVIGYQQWGAYQVREAAKKAHQLEQVRLQKLAELNARTGADQSLTALDHPWASMAGVEDFLNGCQGAIDALPLALGGWTLESALCNPRTIESVYGRTGKTTFNDLIAATQGLFPSRPVLMQGAERAGLGDEIKLGAGGDDELMPFEALQAAFTSHLQALDVQAAIVEVAVAAIVVPAPLPGQPQAVRSLAPDWKKFSFSLTSLHTPKSLFAGLDFLGVRLTEISVVRTGAQLSWSLKGEMYAR